MNLSDTICAVSTPPGVGGIAVIRISGNQAIEALKAIWKGSDPSAWKTHTAHLGTILDAAGEPLDQCVATVFLAPGSYTGQDTVELSVHGSPYVQAQAVASLCANGCRLADAGEFTRRAFAAGHINLAQAEAIADIISSRTRAANTLAQAQLRGGVTKRIEGLRQQLIDLASLLELELDFSEEDVEFASREKLREIASEVLRETERLADSFVSGSAIKDGIPTAIVGPPNAGKSSLLNALLGDERAIVSHIPGTTRDIIEDTLPVGDYTLRLMDTAGLRETDNEVERIGIDLAHRSLSRALIVVAVLDSADPNLETQASELLTKIKEANPAAKLLTILNKSDVSHRAASEDADSLVVSAKTGAGIDALRSRLEELCREIAPIRPDATITSLRQQQTLRSASDSLRETLQSLESTLPGDLIAQSLRAATTALAEFTGAITSDTILHTVFSRFCVGK